MVYSAYLNWRALMSIFYQSRTGRVWFHLSENHSFDSHLHRQVELLIVLEGGLAATIDYREYQVSAGEGIIIFPNRLHSFFTPENSRILICIFDSSFCHDFRKFFQSGIPENPHFILKDFSCHSQLALQELLKLTSQFDLSQQLPEHVISYAQGYLTLLLTDIFSGLSLSAEREYSDPELEQQLLLYIDRHYTDNLTLEHLAREFGVSPFRISRIFSAKLQTSFPHYVNSRRLEYAKELLANSGLSVTRIALDAGFGSARTFFREFKRAFCVSPGEFRRGSNAPAPAESPPRS